MLTVGVAIVVADVGLLSVGAGVQLYADPPDAESCTDALLQIVVSFDTVVMDTGCTTTFTESRYLQVFASVI